jgi:hypothetical protein
MTPRTACTAIGEVLCEHFGGEYLPAEDICAPDGRILVQQKHGNLEELLRFGILKKTEAESLLKFCSVRNPFDSLVSLYIKKRYKYQPLLEDPSSWVHRVPGYARDMRFCSNHSFETWITRVCCKKIIQRTVGLKPSMYRSFTQGMDVVMRYENLQDDFKKVLTNANIDWDSSIPRINRTEEKKNTDYHTFYGKSSRKLVEFAYYHDLNSYGYSFH